MLAPTMVVPSLLVAAAATLVIATWTAVGLVNPGMVNVIGWPPVKVPAVNETVKTNEDPPPAASAAVPVGLPDDGAVNVRAAAPEDASARPAPLSVMIILPLLATCDAGASVTLMVTVVAPFATLLSVIAGCTRKGANARIEVYVTKFIQSMLFF